MKNHPWHDVETGQQAPSTVNAIIEISRGSKAKYEVDKTTGLLRLDRVLHASFFIRSIMASFHKPMPVMATRLISSYFPKSIYSL
ncbi:inorganic pyrophosphatase [Filimonas sp.]|nr:inorganic pyrophosphatase [Filimonas sp.]